MVMINPGSIVVSSFICTCAFTLYINVYDYHFKQDMFNDKWISFYLACLTSTWYLLMVERTVLRFLDKQNECFQIGS